MNDPIMYHWYPTFNEEERKWETPAENGEKFVKALDQDLSLITEAQWIRNTLHQLQVWSNKRQGVRKTDSNAIQAKKPLEHLMQWYVHVFPTQRQMMKKDDWSPGNKWLVSEIKKEQDDSGEEYTVYTYIDADAAADPDADADADDDAAAADAAADADAPPQHVSKMPQKSQSNPSSPSSTPYDPDEAHTRKSKKADQYEYMVSYNATELTELIKDRSSTTSESNNLQVSTFDAVEKFPNAYTGFVAVYVQLKNLGLTDNSRMTKVLSMIGSADEAATLVKQPMYKWVKTYTQRMRDDKSVPQYVTDFNAFDNGKLPQTTAITGFEDKDTSNEHILCAILTNTTNSILPETLQKLTNVTCKAVYYPIIPKDGIPIVHGEGETSFKYENFMHKEWLKQSPQYIYEFIQIECKIAYLKWSITDKGIDKWVSSLTNKGLTLLL